MTLPAESAVCLPPGMSDDELEATCQDTVSGLAPWAYWTSEVYSFGKCIRRLCKYPNSLPLFVYADHGVGLHSNLFPHELQNGSNVFLTYHPRKEERYRTFKEKRVLRIPHPWINYRRSSGIERARLARGTLVFISHSAPGFRWEGEDCDRYFEALRSLGDKYQPVVLCLHMHDIKSGRHRALRRHGFPIVTAGNTSSVRFVDRFYELLRGFSYATSQTWGSHVAYAVELGVPFFLLGPKPTLVNLSHTDMPLGEVKYQDEYHEEWATKADALFTMAVDEPTFAQHQFVVAVLGLDSTITGRQLSFILWKELFRQWRQWWPMWLKPLAASFRRRTLFELIRRVRYRMSAYKR